MTFAFKPYPFTAKTYEAVVPPLDGQADARRHKVAIVGAGPVGLSLALGLANHGVASIVIEADRSVCQGSRAICLSRRSMEIIQRLGALPSFREKGLPWTGGRSFFREAEVLHFHMPHDENQKLPPMTNIEQFYIEQFLLDEVERRADLIDIRWGCRCVSLETGDAGVTLGLSTEVGDYALHADWIVGCDGGRSFVRETLGLKLDGLSYEGRYVIVDVLLDSQRPTERLAWFDPPSNPGSSILMHRQPDNVWRIDYQIGADEDPDEAVKPENVIPRVRAHLEMIGETGEWSPLWITMYKAHALTLDRYRHGRALLAGDAAHLLPIFGVRGANSGFDDADNLAWKLAFVVKELASERLLDTYSDERVLAARENIRHGSKSTEFMAPPSFAFELMREAVLTLACDHPCVQPLINPRQSAIITYEASPLNVDSDDLPEGPGPGAVLHEAPLTLCRDGGEQEGFLTDLIGPRFTLLHFTADGRVPPDLADAATGLGPHVPFAIVPLCEDRPERVAGPAGWDRAGRLFAMYGARPGTAYLVRPDGHVLARWRAASAQAVRAALALALR